MISVTQARKLIVQHVNPLPSQSIPLARVHGRVLREPLLASEDMPPFDRSAVDGYVIREDDSADEFDVIGEIRAGEAIDRPLQPGQTIRILTGARLPAQNLSVIMQEQVEICDGRMRILKRGGPGNVRKKGEDARAGEVLLESGITLEAISVALLASVGKTFSLVSRQAKILHLTTGDEIVPPEQTPAPGQIRNSNASLIASLCREQGIEEILHLHAQDDLKTMIDLVTQAKPETYDLILISGGSGPGTYDFSADLFRHLGATIHFREVNVRPGKPLIFGTSSSQVVFGLPGNVLSHFVCFQLFVRVALDRLLGRTTPTATRALLVETMGETMNARETWWPARAEWREGRLECRALPWKSSGDITRMSAANALIQVPASTPRLMTGTLVDLLLTQLSF